jgi:hypothetical protein
MINLLTFDIVDWFHTLAQQQSIDKPDWDRTESRIISNVHILLELLALQNHRATFFLWAGS